MDVYSFAMVLYEMVTNKVPFKGLTTVQVAHTVANTGIRHPSDTTPTHPPTQPPLRHVIIWLCGMSCDKSDTP